MGGGGVEIKASISQVDISKWPWHLPEQEILHLLCNQGLPTELGLPRAATWQLLFIYF